MKPDAVLIVVALLSLVAAHAQAENASRRPIVIDKFDAAKVHVQIDGKLNEPVWQDLPVYDRMVVTDPDTLKKAPDPTRLRLFYTRRGLYIGVANEQDPDTLVSRLSARDGHVPRDDVAVTLDPSGQGLYAYWFSVNLGGTLQDGTVLPERQFSSQWDGPWYGASAETDDGWSAEFFLPWSMMSMPEVQGKVRRMGFYISREVSSRDEKWAWPALPKTRNVYLSQLQAIQFEGIKPVQQFTFYPFASTTYDNTVAETKYQAGFDFYWRPSSNLQFTATVNPDFGNVESDDVVVNLTSFETFYPEKRPFFLEGNEIFVTTPRARDDHSPTTLVNTRRIGGPPRLPAIPDLALTDLEENQPSALNGALKVTGQNGRFRYGVLTAMEEDTKIHGTVNGIPITVRQDGRDFDVARLLYEDTGGGSRRSLGWITTAVLHPQGDAIVHGIDGHLLTADGNWNVDGQLMRSDVDDVTGNGGFVDVDYTPKRGKQHRFGLEYYDRKLDINDFGFQRRNDALGIEYSYQVTESNLEHLKSRTTRIFLSQQYNLDGRSVRSGIFTSQRRQFHNNTSLDLDLNYFPPRWDDINSDGNGAYRIDGRRQFRIGWGSDRSKPLATELALFLHDEDLGGYTTQGEIELNWRPTDRFSLSTKINYEKKDGWLIHNAGRAFTTYEAENWRPRVELGLFFTARQEFRITAQWAGIKAFEQERWLVPPGDGDLLHVTAAPDAPRRDFTISRLTFQARYRWELAPLSDLFVVYTRGSDVDNMPGEGFDKLLEQSWTEPLVDILVVKLRYRFGS